MLALYRCKLQYAFQFENSTIFKRLHNLENLTNLPVSRFNQVTKAKPAQQVKISDWHFHWTILNFGQIYGKILDILSICHVLKNMFTMLWQMSCKAAFRVSIFKLRPWIQFLVLDFVITGRHAITRWPVSSIVMSGQWVSASVCFFLSSCHQGLIMCLCR